MIFSLVPRPDSDTEMLGCIVLVDWNDYGGMDWNCDKATPNENVYSFLSSASPQSVLPHLTIIGFIFSKYPNIAI